MITDNAVVLFLIIPVAAVLFLLFALAAINFMVWLGNSIWSAIGG